jgi:hypothetical protein
MDQDILHGNQAKQNSLSQQESEQGQKQGWKANLAGFQY